MASSEAEEKFCLAKDMVYVSVCERVVCVGRVGWDVGGVEGSEEKKKEKREKGKRAPRMAPFILSERQGVASSDRQSSVRTLSCQQPRPITAILHP